MHVVVAKEESAVQPPAREESKFYLYLPQSVCGIYNETSADALMTLLKLGVCFIETKNVKQLEMTASACGMVKTYLWTFRWILLLNVFGFC